MNEQEPPDASSPQNAEHSPLPPPPDPSPKMVEQSTVLPSTPGPSTPMPVQEPAVIVASVSGAELSSITTPAAATQQTPACGAPPKPGRRLGPAITVIFLGLLSFVLGLALFSSSKTAAPEGVAGSFSPAKMNKQLNDMWLATRTILEQPAEPKKAGADPKTDPKTDPKPVQKFDPQPEPEPLPPESIRFAGRKAGDERSANGLQMNLCWCPAGNFVMGSPKNEKDRDYSAEQVEVTLTKGFWLGKYEVTQEQWERVMGTTLIQQLDITAAQERWERQNPDSTWWWSRLTWRPQRRARYPDWPDFGEGPSFPMYYVNHLEASDFCQKLTEQERKAGRLPPGWAYRLPTEAQWEYACRAGTKTATAFGDSLSSREANFDGSLPLNGAAPGPKLGDLGRTQPVGSYQPNGWGLCDMHGNAWEWCRDWAGQPPGGTDPEVKLGTLNRVVRGGSWRSPGKLCRSATRMAHKWSTQDFETGFRVAIVQLDPQPKPAPELADPRPLPRGILTNSIGMKLATIPAGKFLMGSPVDEPGRAWLGSDEIDFEEQHAVTIREPFYLGVYLVTQEQYQQIMGNAPGHKPSYFSPEGGGKEKVWRSKDTRQFPRDSVSWDEVQEFCRRLSDLPEEKRWGRVYRLPTEEEWEYACRAGTSTPYYFGKTISPEQANFGNNLGRSTPVGYYNSPNRFGLFDMHGNLLQWCDGSYAPYQKDLRDPNRSYSGVQRGGYWGYAGILCRSASRETGNLFGGNYCGFRVALSVDPSNPQPVSDPTPDPKPLPMNAPIDSIGKIPAPKAASGSTDGDQKKDASNPKVPALLNNLKSLDKEIRRAAADQLASIEPDANREKVAKALEGLMTDRNIFVLGAATKALVVWGGKDNVPGLIAVTGDPNIFCRSAAIEVLAALKDERAPEAIARRLSNAFDRGKARESLRAMGPMAEAAVLKRLNHDIKEVRIECCKILRDIGTSKCVPAIEQAARDADADVAREARLTLREVKP